MTNVSSRNRQRGKATEKRVAKKASGSVYTGTAGDVTAHGLRLEVKSAAGLVGLTRLREWLDQAARNGADSGLPWALVFTGGKGYRNAELFAVQPFDDWDRVQREAAGFRRLSELLGGGGDTSREQRILEVIRLVCAEIVAEAVIVPPHGTDYGPVVGGYLASWREGPGNHGVCEGGE